MKSNFRKHIQKGRTINYSCIFNDKNISMAAKGLLLYLLHRPKNWRFEINAIKESCTNGPDSIQSSMKELRKNGYVSLTRIHTNNKISCFRYDVYDVAQDADFTKRLYETLNDMCE